MNTAARDQPETRLDTLLRSAHDALDAGDVQGGRELSHKVLKAAEALGDKRYEARALLCLAHCDRMLSRLSLIHISEPTRPY